MACKNVGFGTLSDNWSKLANAWVSLEEATKADEPKKVETILRRCRDSG